MRRPLLAALALAGAAAATLPVTVTAPATAAPAAAAAEPSRVQAVRWSTPPYHAKYSQSITSEQFSSPAVADINLDGKAEVIAGFPDGYVHVWDASTGRRWLSRWTGAGAVQSSPTIQDVNRDGKPEILVANTAGDVVGFDFMNRVAFRAKTGDGRHQPGNFAAPQVGDINSDGYVDVVQASWDHHLHVYDGRYFGSGTTTREVTGFPFFAKDTIWSTPVIMDMNRDAVADIVLGYDCDGVQGQDCYAVRNLYQRGGYVTILHGRGPYAGKPHTGWPRFVRDQVIWSSPAVTDLNRDGSLDVVVGTGTMPMTGGRMVLAFDRRGNNLPGFPVAVGGRVMASPAIGDLDNDGSKEIAVIADDAYLYVINRDGRIRFKKCITNSGEGCPSTSARLHGSASIADVNGDGRQEVVTGGEQHVYVISGAGATMFSGLLWGNGGPIYSVPFVAAPTVANIDGRAMIYVAAGNPGSPGYGEIYGWRMLSQAGPSQWPTWRQNFRRTGRLEP
jgi:hypothetical protein